MKFSPKKIRNEAELEKTRERLKEQLAAAQKLNDPADRLEAMLQVKDDTANAAADIFGPIAGRSSWVDIASIVGTVFTAVGAGVGLSFVATPAVGIPAMVALLGGGIYGVFKYDPSAKLEQRMQKELAPHVDVLNEILITASKDAKDLLKTSTTEIAASDKFDSLYDRYPSIRDSFIKAFNKAVALKELPPPQPSNSTRKFAL